MKVVYHPSYRVVYASDPAAAPGRIESVYSVLRGKFEFVRPEPAKEEDLRLVHSQSHIDRVKRRSVLYKIALLAAGGAIKASELAVRDEAAFGLIRPPGHHASQDHSWGFCYFNNVAVSIERLRRKGLIEKAIIVDIDLHHGDGTANVFAAVPNVVYHHVEGATRQSFLKNLKLFLESQREYDVIAVSAGFDRHEQDWGGLLKTEDYRTIGDMIRESAEKNCGGRLYAVLEGGYNHAVLGKNVEALLRGLS